ncbi:MAG: hypothetical protein ACE5KY_00970, partial [Candidatus Tectimicrobiota bacterium]
LRPHRHPRGRAQVPRRRGDKGAAVLVEAVRHLERTGAPTLLDQAESLRERIRLTAKAWHEEGEAARRQQAYREAHQEVSSLLTFGSEEGR